MIQGLLLPTLTRGRGQGEINFLSDYDELQPSLASLEKFYRVFIGYVAWQKITGQLSHKNLCRYLFSEYIRRKETKAVGKTLLKRFIFSSLFYCTEEKRTRFLDSSDIKSLLQIHIRHQINIAFFARGSLAILKNNGRAIK